MNERALELLSCVVAGVLGACALEVALRVGMLAVREMRIAEFRAWLRALR